MVKVWVRLRVGFFGFILKCLRIWNVRQDFSLHNTSHGPIVFPENPLRECDF